MLEVIITKEELYDKCENVEQLYDRFYCPLLVEYKELKKQVEEYQQELEKADSITQSCIFNGKEESKISYRKCLNILDKKEVQQKEFINYLEDEMNEHKNKEPFIVANICSSYDLNDIELKLLEEILSKYKSIIGSDINVGSIGGKE